jgi:hypothetical protein
MNKPLDPPDVTGSTLVPADQQEKLPAVKKPINKFRKIKQLAALADEIKDEYDHLNKIKRNLGRRTPGEPLPNIAGIKQMHNYWQQQIDEASELLKLLDNEDQYDDETEDEGRRVKSSVVAKRLGLLIGSKHIGQPTTPEAYTMMLLQHVNDHDEMCYLSLESACRELEAEHKFLPDISEVLTKIDEHFELWWKRRRAIYDLKSEINELIELIETLKPKVALEIAQKEERDARHSLESKLTSHQRAKADVISKQEAAYRAYNVALEVSMPYLRVTTKAVAEAAEKLALAVSAREAAEAAVNQSKPD